jgi:surfeit locus 1 family protein
MTSEAPAGPPPRRFPIVLTLAAIVVILVCDALGLWQLQRLKWKESVLAHIAAMQNAPVQSLSAALAKETGPGSLSGARVAADCAPAPPAKAISRITTDKGDWITRAQSLCQLEEGPYQSVLADRGLIEASRGSTKAADVILPAPNRVVGILYVRSCPGGCGQSAPYTLVAQGETPPPPGVTPAPYPDPRSNLEYVGAYAPTWFGLGGVAACFYAAMLWRTYRRNKPPSD